MGRLRLAWRSSTLAAQDNLCQICTVSLELADVHLDHDHDCCPGPVRVRCLDPAMPGSCIRGALCGNCNLMLGYAQDRPEALRAAADYLDAWQVSRTPGGRTGGPELLRGTPGQEVA